VSIERTIEEAFAAAPMPRTEGELAPPSIECKYVYEHFLGKTRADLEAAHFPGSLYMEDFTYMTDGAVLYYLPSVLRIMLSTLDDELWIFLSGFLNTIDSTYPGPALAELDADQRQAIARWAQTLAARWQVGEPELSSEAAALARKYR
jgi:hypothetical protein